MMTKKDFPDCSNCINRWDNFNNLNDDDLKLVCKNRHIAHFKTGEIIFKQGSPISNAVFMIEGMAKMYIEGYDNKRMMIGIGKPGRLYAGPGTFVDNKHHYTMSALTDVVACFINMEVIKSFVHNNGKFAEGFLKDISKKSLDTFYRYLSHSQKKMHGRLADTILYLANEVYQSDKFSMILSRQELGELSGMAKESAVRILKDFSEDKIITDNGSEIEILNKDKLKMISQMG